MHKCRITEHAQIIFYAKPYWWYSFRLYLADPAEWNLRSFWKNTYLFFFLWILGIDHFNELAAGRLYDDHLYRRYPEYSGRADRGGKNGRGVQLAVIEECYDSNGNAIHHDLYILNTDELFPTGSSIECLKDVKRKHLRIIGRLSCCQCQVLIEQFERVRQC